MTKQIKQYIAEIELVLSAENSKTEWAQIRKEMLIRIRFYQHERLIHLIITMSFAIMLVIFFAAAFISKYFLPLAGLFLILEIPYIRHYYFLENSVQKLYDLYSKFA
ncbi:MAG: hypothetical protein LBR74_03475 [Eubacterium sp.]|jgi:hypothetical protein|nr:hypothetical protein [Eubacterium sp.]